MDQQSVYTNPQQQHMQLWIRSCSLACGFALVLLVIFASNVFSVARSSVLNEAPERINPNTASAGSLIRLSGIGKAKAMDIIHYRDQATRPAFSTAEDLEEIRGIGPKTVAKLKPYLTFELENADQRNTH